ncbi:MAG: hypothetical protein GC159_19465 [Phycisphaera sp.]|nr:hypothetical protein [Phycisphaera sp.]
MLGRKIFIKTVILMGKMATSLGLPRLLPIPRPSPLPIRAVKWYFLSIVLPALLLDMAYPLSRTTIIMISVLGGVLGTWALTVIGIHWFETRAERRAEFDEAQRRSRDRQSHRRARRRRKRRRRGDDKD